MVEEDREVFEDNTKQFNMENCDNCTENNRRMDTDITILVSGLGTLYVTRTQSEGKVTGE